MPAMDMVTIVVDGRPVMVPGHTNASEIRKIARCGPGCPLSMEREGINVIVYGNIDVSEGDHFMLGRSFTKANGLPKGTGRDVNAKVQGTFLQEAAENR
jgi:hypothetical protein